jgi:hypothetical protein
MLAGTVQQYGSLKSGGHEPAMLAAGLATIRKDRYGLQRRNTRGHLLVRCKYSIHRIRHFYASLGAHPKGKDGVGLGLSPHHLCARMGHANVMTTLSIYAHLFPSTDTGEELTAAERVMHFVDAPPPGPRGDVVPLKK